MGGHRPKSSCGGCKALITDDDSIGVPAYRCGLRYGIKMDIPESSMLGVLAPVPIDVCPKPRTMKQYLKLRGHSNG